MRKNEALRQAMNPSTPPEQLRGLATSGGMKVMRAVAKNPNTPSEVLFALGSGDCPEEVLANQALPLFALEDPENYSIEIKEIKDRALHLWSIRAPEKKRRALAIDYVVRVLPLFETVSTSRIPRNTILVARRLVAGLATEDERIVAFSEVMSACEEMRERQEARKTELADALLAEEKDSTWQALHDAKQVARAARWIVSNLNSNGLMTIRLNALMAATDTRDEERLWQWERFRAYKRGTPKPWPLPPLPEGR